MRQCPTRLETLASSSKPTLQLQTTVSAVIRLRALPILCGQPRLAGSKRRGNSGCRHRTTCRTHSRQSTLRATVLQVEPSLTSDRARIIIIITPWAIVMGAQFTSKLRRWRRVRVAELLSRKLQHSRAVRSHFRWFSRPGRSPQILLQQRLLP